MFADNLQILRKRSGITQEELAERLEVSRQSVSKWETGEAFPEIDKLIVICEIFGTDMDSLVRGDISGGGKIAEAESGAKTAENAVYPDTMGFSAHMNGFAVRIAAGVFAVIFGVAVMLLFMAFSAKYEEKETVLTVLGVVALLVFVAAAMPLFIISGISHNEFLRRLGKAENYFTDGERQAFNKKFAVGIAVSVSVIIAAVAALIAFQTYAASLKLETREEEFVATAITAGFMFVIAFAVGALCLLGILRYKYDACFVGEGNTAEKTRKQKICGAIQSSVMLTATAVFLLLGFVWSLWHPAWVAFPIGGILCGVISVIFDAKK